MSISLLGTNEDLMFEDTKCCLGFACDCEVGEA